MAQGRLDAHYQATLGGIPLGRGAWLIDVTDDQFTAAVSGTTSGLVRLFTSGKGTSASRGVGQPAASSMPAAYSSSIDDRQDDTKTSAWRSMPAR